MKKLVALIATIFGLSSEASTEESTTHLLDYNKLIFLDAEDLAEQGILEAYEELKPELSKYLSDIAEVEEIFDKDTPSYKVISQGETFTIYGPGLDENEGQSWGRAAHAFFSIVNLQLQKSDIKLYAINGGNDLGGLFLTASQYEAAINSVPRRTDWPYLPKLEPPWYGQPN